ncbi:MAG: type II toxin-antitoxin system VapC family toxin [Planctomycetes bacterium]|nr:type II toxin-antitoxin system VapC family toxin [Planctomycetota bacterium]
MSRVRLLVDTNRFADLVANDRQARERLQQASELWLSVITIGALRAGFTQGRRRGENEQRLTELLQLQGVGVLPIDADTASHYADIWRSLRRRGKPIPTNDIWIAAQCLQHQLILDTSDQHVSYVQGLSLTSD